LALFRAFGDAKDEFDVVAPSNIDDGCVIVRSVRVVVTVFCLSTQTVSRGGAVVIPNDSATAAGVVIVDNDDEIFVEIVIVIKRHERECRVDDTARHVSLERLAECAIGCSSP
jgi:hypothetical protein